MRDATSTEGVGGSKVWTPPERDRRLKRKNIGAIFLAKKNFPVPIDGGQGGSNLWNPFGAAPAPPTFTGFLLGTEFLAIDAGSCGIVAAATAKCSFNINGLTIERGSKCREKPDF